VNSFFFRLSLIIVILKKKIYNHSLFNGVLRFEAYAGLLKEKNMHSYRVCVQAAPFQLISDQNNYFKEFLLLRVGGIFNFFCLSEAILVINYFFIINDSLFMFV